MPIPTPATVARRTRDLTDEEFLSSHAFAYLSLEDAARDPRTPEEYLIGSGVRSEDQFFALINRPTIGPGLAHMLARAARQSRTSLSPVAKRANEAVAAVAALPDTDQWRLLDLAGALDTWGADFLTAAGALLRHPACTERVAVEVLCCSGVGTGRGQTPLEREVASHGWLASAALRLLVLEGAKRLRTPRNDADQCRETVAELEAVIGTDAAWRRTVAALGPTWNGTRAALLETALTVSR